MPKAFLGVRQLIESKKLNCLPIKEMIRSCIRIRKIEEKISEIYPSDKIQSPVHLSNGQEAVSVGVCENLLKTNIVFGA